ncbi:DUF4913 domain-containing protein [Streptomyces sp. NPDC051987]|uniref:DUF4913 domain-containing protein n=1 Tax=Streptomyces sp. NPDC051987 TaxID=3155808 RepID=UPI00342A23D0
MPSAQEQQEEQEEQEEQQKDQQKPVFILYLTGAEHDEALRGLMQWVRHLLLPVYGREVTSTAPWCTSWWLHREAVAQLYGLWLSWQELTSAAAGLTGPAIWHRDHLAHVMNALRDPSGPFAGCKANGHREKEPPGMAAYGE